jgi:hypothetical protein
VNSALGSHLPHTAPNRAERTSTWRSAITLAQAFPVKWRHLRKKLVIATAAVLGLGIAIPAHAASEIDCMVMWEKAEVNKNGTLEGNEATAYLDAIRKSGKKYEMKTVGHLSSTEFMAACKDDAFKISFYRV